MEESRGALLFQKVCHILNIILKVAVMVIIAFPFYWMVSTSLKDYTEALQFPPTLFPSSLHWENYAHVFEIVPIGLYFRNSVVVSLCVLVLQYLIIVPAAYSFARHEYFGKNIFFGIVLLGLMIPQQITFLPVYLMFSRMKMLKTFIPLILPFISNPFGIFMLRQYFMQIPQEVIEAAKLANADGFISQLPDGYQTDIGQRGVKLSGGQKQRLSIARVFLKNPAILIFDEATSALDNESEKIVQESMEKLAKGRTTFVIAHRLSTIRNAGRILVLTANGIEEEGTHEELLARNGIYAKLYHGR